MKDKYLVDMCHLQCRTLTIDDFEMIDILSETDTQTNFQEIKEQIICERVEWAYDVGRMFKSLFNI